MSETAIREALYDTLSALPIGRVYKYKRFSAQLGDDKRVYFDGARLNVWMLSRIGARTEWLSVAERQVVHQYALQGFYGLRDGDESELAFNAQVEAVCSAFGPDYTDPAGYIQSITPWQIEVIDERMLGTHLVHHASLTIEVAEVTCLEGGD